MGANQGRAKENKQEAEYGNLEGRHEKSGRRERGNRGSESGIGHRGSRCEAKPGREGKEKQRQSSQNPKLKRTKESENSGGEKAETEQTVGLESGKPTGREAERRNGKGRAGRSSCRD